MSLQEIANEQEYQNQLAEILGRVDLLQQQMNSLTNSITSNSEANNLTIFSELRTLLKEQNEQEKRNLNDNANLLRNNAESIYNNLKNSVSELSKKIEQATNGMSGTMARATESVCNSATAGIKNASNELIKFKNEWKKQVTYNLNEMTEAATENIKAEKQFRHEKLRTPATWIFAIMVGGFLFFCGYLAVRFFDVQHDYYKQLAEEKKLEQIQKKAVSDYRKYLLNSKSGIVEICELDKKWAENENNVQWKDKKKVLEAKQKDIDDWKKWLKNTEDDK